VRSDRRRFLVRAPDLYALKRELGGLVYGGGRQWIGPGPGHSRQDRSLSVRVTDYGRLVWHSFAGDPPDIVRAHLGIDGQQQASQDWPTANTLDRPALSATASAHGRAG
jgi:hypothetical protein